MASVRKQEANRRNAARSTGPKTEAGKRAAARNALRHGLSVASLADPSWAQEVHALAGTFATMEASPILREQAYKVAAAQVDLVRVRLVRHEVVSKALADVNFEPRMQTYIRNVVVESHGQLPPGSYERLMMALEIRPKGDRKLAYIYSELFDELMKLDRYECRALSRRRKAMRAFDKAARRLPGSLLRAGMGPTPKAPGDGKFGRTNPTAPH